jgi:hypothetical protein
MRKLPDVVDALCPPILESLYKIQKLPKCLSLSNPNIRRFGVSWDHEPFIVGGLE